MAAGASSTSILTDLAGSAQMSGRRDYWKADIVTLFAAQSEIDGGIAMQVRSCSTAPLSIGNRAIVHTRLPN